MPNDTITITVKVDTGLVGSTRTETYKIPREEWEEMDDKARSEYLAELEDQTRDRYVSVWAEVDG